MWWTLWIKTLKRCIAHSSFSNILSGLLKPTNKARKLVLGGGGIRSVYWNQFSVRSVNRIQLSGQLLANYLTDFNGTLHMAYLLWYELLGVNIRFKPIYYWKYLQTCPINSSQTIQPISETSYMANYHMNLWEWISDSTQFTEVMSL